MNDSKISRAALGEVGALGDLYDARTSKFCGISIFNQNIPSEAVSLVDNRASEFRFSKTDSYVDKFQLIDVTGELQVIFANLN